MVLTGARRCWIVSDSDAVWQFVFFYTEVFAHNPSTSLQQLVCCNSSCAATARVLLVCCNSSCAA